MECSTGALLPLLVVLQMRYFCLSQGACRHTRRCTLQSHNHSSALALQVREVLAHIEAGALLPPLVVLQTLAKNPQLKLSVVKDYAARTLSAEGAAVEEDRKAIARFQEETASMRAEITELKTKVCCLHG